MILGVYRCACRYREVWDGEGLFSRSKGGCHSLSGKAEEVDGVWFELWKHVGEDATTEITGH